jgi:hypothetical protein
MQNRLWLPGRLAEHPMLVMAAESVLICVHLWLNWFRYLLSAFFIRPVALANAQIL